MVYIACIVFKIFLECRVLLCDFHREQAWDRWLSATSNNMRPVKELVLPRLRRIANAESLDEFNKSVASLEASDEWNGDHCAKFRQWMSKTWLPSHKVSLQIEIFLVLDFKKTKVLFEKNNF